MSEKTQTKTIAENRKARHDYFVIESFEAGVELFGTEVKSLRAGGVNLKDSYCDVDGGELFALGVHISPYEQNLICFCSYLSKYTCFCNAFFIRYIIFIKHTAYCISRFIQFKIKLGIFMYTASCVNYIIFNINVQ